MLKPHFFGQIVAGKFSLDSSEREKFEIWCETLPDGGYGLFVDKVTDKRTTAQNNSVHKYCELLAKALNAAGLNPQKVLEVDLEWTPALVKEGIWRPIQKAQLGKQSTTELKKQGDIDLVYEVLNRAISEKFGVHVPFPSIETQKLND